MLLLLSLWSSLRRRPLNLTEDPSNLAAVGRLTLNHLGTRRLLIGTENLSSEETNNVLTKTRHRLSEGDLLSVGQRDALPSSSKQAKSWRPLAIKRRNALCLLLFLCALLATIAALGQIYPARAASASHRVQARGRDAKLIWHLIGSSTRCRCYPAASDAMVAVWCSPPSRLGPIPGISSVS